MTKAQWFDTLERLLWTFVQGALSLPILDGLGWVELGDDAIWKAMAAGGIGAVLSALKSIASSQLSQGGTAQAGVKTYSYTEAGPGSAGDLGEANFATIAWILVIVILVFVLLRVAGAL